jgi:hypothetical protein
MVLDSDFDFRGSPLSNYAWMMIAHHEAGHAVLGHFLGFQIKSIRFRNLKEDGPRLDSLAGVSSLAPNKGKSSSLRPIMVLAGPMATRKFDLDMADQIGLKHDLDEFNCLVKDEHERERYKRMTFLLVWKCWPEIQAVASELYRKGGLSGKDVQDIIKITAGQLWKEQKSRILLTDTR